MVWVGEGDDGQSCAHVLDPALDGNRSADHGSLLEDQRCYVAQRETQHRQQDDSCVQLGGNSDKDVREDEDFHRLADDNDAEAGEGADLRIHDDRGSGKERGKGIRLIMDAHVIEQERRSCLSLSMRWTTARPVVAAALERD